MRVVFMGSPPFALPVLERLLASDVHETCALVTPPDRPRGRGRSVIRSELALMADAAGVPVIQPNSTKDPEFLQSLAAFEPDVLAVASYGEILRTDVLELAPHGALNVHGSLLPRWRGASPIQAAILAGDAESGVSIQRMVLALDAGDVLLERRTPIGPQETSGELFERLAESGACALIDALDALADGSAQFQPQDQTAVTICRKLSKQDGVLDWSDPAEALARRVRAMTPWPGARTSLPDGRALVVLEARVHTGESGAPGSLLEGPGLRIATGDGALELIRIKPAGKGAMDAAAFQNGAQLQTGTLFGAQG
ncbi:MAG: methionyl-tRNA formyltransferase [Planctomycetota bacterium]